MTLHVLSMIKFELYCLNFFTYFNVGSLDIVIISAHFFFMLKYSVVYEIIAVFDQ